MTNMKKLQEQIYKLKEITDKTLLAEIFINKLRKIKLEPNKPENKELKLILINKKMEKIIDIIIRDTWEY